MFSSYINLELSQPPTFDKSWAINEEGGLDLMSNLPTFIVVLLIVVGIIMIVLGDVTGGVITVGVGLALGLTFYVLSRPQESRQAKAT
jgi:energy-converting hydrogenase Eha subunit G